ncbi:MAG: prepilin-type N-terminal cleavage/methylation domain-containing protein [bacterium]|nr:prepilin-type N-terminal cleavage/methylation domain-containing protein [bacterium]
MNDHRKPVSLPARQDGAFTLVEVLIVVVVLGILAAIVVPQFSDASTDAMASALQTNVSSIQTQLDIQYHKSGAYPLTVDATLFAGNKLPTHPGNDFGVPSVQVLSSAGLPHPANKVLKGGVGGAYWYNPAGGVLRARVTDMGSAAATLDFYNLVNRSNESDLGNYGGGGGS